MSIKQERKELEDRIVEACEKLKAKGFKISRGVWAGNYDTPVCCALGAVCILADRDPRTEIAAILLGESFNWVEGFIEGFDGGDGLDYGPFGEEWLEAMQIGANVAKRVL